MRDFRPLEAMRAVGELPLSARHKAVLWALITFVDREGRCWPSHATLAARAGVSKSTVKATVGELMALGHLSKTHRQLAGTVEADSNLYVVHVRAEVDRRRPEVGSNAPHPGPAPADPEPRTDPPGGHLLADVGSPPPYPEPLGDPPVGCASTQVGRPPADPGSSHGLDLGLPLAHPGPEVGQELSMERIHGTVHGTGREGESARLSHPPPEFGSPNQFAGVRAPPQASERQPARARALVLVSGEPLQTPLPIALPPAKAKARGRGARIAEDWQPKPETLARFRTRERIDAAGSVERFRNHFLASGGPHAVKLDWDRAFINWVLRDLDEGRAQPLPAADAPPSVRSTSSTLPEGEAIATGEALAQLAREAALAAGGARARMAHRLSPVGRNPHSDAG